MATLLHRCNRIYMTRVRYRQSCGLDIWSVLLSYLFVSRIAWRVFAFVFALVLFFPSPPIRSGEASRLLFFLSFSSFICFLDVAMVWKGKPASVTTGSRGRTYVRK